MARREVEFVSKKNFWDKHISDNRYHLILSDNRFHAERGSVAKPIEGRQEQPAEGQVGIEDRRRHREAHCKE